MENKQTAIEWFFNAIKDQINLSEEHLEMVESYARQCKEIEQEQIIDAYRIGYIKRDEDKLMEAKKYYNETYGE